VKIDRTHRKWLIASLLILAAATAVYAPYALKAPHGPSGASRIGLGFGIAGFTFMIFAGLLGARKKVPVWRLGRGQTWMRGHLWLGFLSLPLILFHGGFHFGGTLTTVLMILLILVVASGVFGAILQNYLPNVMRVEVPFETIFEEIEHVRAELLEEADQFVAAAIAPGGTGGLAAPVAERGGVLTDEDVAVTVAEAVPLQKFYEREVRPFLVNPGGRGHKLAESAQARAMFQGLRTLLPPALHETVKDLEDICQEERQLRHQVRLHHWLHGWLLFHVPLSLSLLLLGAAHAVMALRY
jgi:hypothetical protein